MNISRSLHTLFANALSGNPKNFYDHWNKHISNNHKNEFHEFNDYNAVPIFFKNHAYSLLTFLVTLESLTMRCDVGYGDPILDEGDGCWFPENDDYNEIPLSQIMFKFGDHLDYISDDELKKIVLIVANICLDIFNEYNYPLDIPERNRLTEITRRAEEL
jgi:hypothetical protein